jgi:hypothetical protein
VRPSRASPGLAFTAILLLGLWVVIRSGLLKWALRRSGATTPAAPIEYSPWPREVVIGALETCRELGIGFVADSPLQRRSGR